MIQSWKYTDVFLTKTNWMKVSAICRLAHLAYCFICLCCVRGCAERMGLWGEKKRQELKPFTVGCQEIWHVPMCYVFPSHVCYLAHSCHLGKFEPIFSLLLAGFHIISPNKVGSGLNSTEVLMVLGSWRPSLSTALNRETDFRWFLKRNRKEAVCICLLHSQFEWCSHWVISDTLSKKEK